MTQEFHISVTPLGSDEYLVRTERVAPGVPLAEEQVVWSVEDWLAQARQLMNDPLLGLLQGDTISRIGGFELPEGLTNGLDPELAPPLSFVELGQRLYSALFQGTLRDSWMTAQGIAQHRGEVLRLRLGLKGLRLPRLPWEVMHGSDSPGQRQRDGLVPAPRPLATGTDVVFSRYQPGKGLGGMASGLTVEPGQPLRILMAIAAPTDQERLELNREAHHLQQELCSSLSSTSEGGTDSLPEIHLTILDQPGREQLTQALEQGQYQVLHYAGHSNLGASGGNLYLVNSKTGLTEILSGDDLAGLLVNNGIRMAVFNSCRGTYTAASDPIADFEERNLAEALVSRGIPAVLAMAERIPDDVALTLTRLLYRNLKQGYPIDLSLSRARQGLISAYGSHRLYWALPILYLHPDFDGYLIGGDRAFENSADRLLLSLPIYDSPVFTEEEPLLPLIASTGTRNSAAEDLQIISEAVLAGDDLSDLVEQEYEAGFSSNQNLSYEDEELSYEEDAAVVADLIQQLSDPEFGLEEMSAPTNGVLVSETDRSGLEVYQSLPNNSFYRDSYVAPSRDSILTVNGNESVASHSDLDSSKIAIADASLAKTDESRLNRTDTPPVQISSAIAASTHKFLNLWQGFKRPSIFLPLLGAAGAAAVFAGFQMVPGLIHPGPSDLPESPSATPGTANPTVSTQPNLKTVDTATLTAIAISKFNQNDLAAGQQAVEELLNRGALQEAKAALDAVPKAQLDTPGINFWRGRLAWESIKRENTDFSYDDARRFWERSAKSQPDSPQYQNALGFAYYAEGNSRKAIQAWCQSLTLMSPSASSSTQEQISSETGETNCPLPTQSTPNEDALTAAAGIALALQQASTDPTGESKALISRATDLYKVVMQSAPIQFQPTELQKNWLWTIPAVEAWQTLSTL